MQAWGTASEFRVVRSISAWHQTNRRTFCELVTGVVITLCAVCVNGRDISRFLSKGTERAFRQRVRYLS